VVARFGGPTFFRGEDTGWVRGVAVEIDLFSLKIPKEDSRSAGVGR
jgi:hypothetical protein